MYIDVIAQDIQPLIYENSNLTNQKRYGIRHQQKGFATHSDVRIFHDLLEDPSLHADARQSGTLHRMRNGEVKNP